MRKLLLVAAMFLTLTLAPSARAFCGFYVSDADQKLYNNATMVVLMRDGDRSVLSMQNNYQGPPEKFALVVPVPQVLHKENVRTLPRDVFDKIDRLASPRLVEYWEQDPCTSVGTGQGFGNGHGRLGGMGEGIGGGGVGQTVRVEARFEVGEYEIVILSASDSSGLDTWLHQERYHVPDGAEPVLRPYVQAGMKFFVAKVDPTRVKFENGQAMLSPLRFYYDTDKFTLPVRLGLLNSAGTQDLIIHILGKSQRYEVANYPNVTIPTNLDVAEDARARFPELYAALFDATVAKNPGAVVTEYSWSSGTCDPCPTPPLDDADLATLGEDVLGGNDGGVMATVNTSRMTPSIRQGATTVTGALPPEVIQRIVRQNFGRFRLCYENGLRTNPSLAGTVNVGFTIGKAGDVAKADADPSSTMSDPNVVACVTRGFGNLSFPQPDKGIVSVLYPIIFNASSWGGGGRSSSNLVLTRLHARYGRDSLGEDLVFRTAGAIVGGREIRSEAGGLEHGAVPSTNNNFQARYAIRHPWSGPIACATPTRGIWGGPPNAAAPSPIAAQKLAFAPRGKVELASMLRQSVPELSLGGTALVPATGAPPSPEAPEAVVPMPAPARRSFCAVCSGPGPRFGVPGTLVAVAFGLVLARRRRRPRACRTRTVRGRSTAYCRTRRRSR
jgi:hypothetical protein